MTALHPLQNTDQAEGAGEFDLPGAAGAPDPLPHQDQSPRGPYYARHDDPLSRQDFPDPPAAHRALAGAGGRDRGRGRGITDQPGEQVPAEAAGELTVIGSGIETVGFSRADELVIDAADKVFYCVADPATAVWLKERRPDAYDLYVLYDDAKLRHVTYMQMTEAMLHFVRQGMRVVAIFYGHPGVFVLSTHRAIAIARREGHRAVMRAGVSALDTMCADLGFDPSQPGLMTYEATDMIVRRRQPDPALHVVLWQVGLIGELGYRRQGFLNSGFSLLLDHLEAVYVTRPGGDPLRRLALSGRRAADRPAHPRRTARTGGTGHRHRPVDVLPAAGADRAARLRRCCGSWGCSSPGRPSSRRPVRCG